MLRWIFLFLGAVEASAMIKVETVEKGIEVVARNEEEMSRKLALIREKEKRGAVMEEIAIIAGIDDDRDHMGWDLDKRIGGTVKDYIAPGTDDEGEVVGKAAKLSSNADADELEEMFKAGKIVLNEEEALGLAHLCRVHTFTEWNSESAEHRKLLKLWLRNWFSLGVRPKILRREDAGKVFMMEFVPPAYGSDMQWYETSHFTKWMTLYQQGGGLMVDYDMFGMRQDMPIVREDSCYNRPTQVFSHREHVGGLVHGTRIAINLYTQSLIQLGYEEQEAKRTAGQKLMITDKSIAKKYPERLFQHLYDFPGIFSLTSMKAMEESRLLGVKIDRYDWLNDLLRLNVLNRYRLEILVPQDETLKAHPARTMLDTIKCPMIMGKEGAVGWKPVMPSSLEDIETVLPISDAVCSVKYWNLGGPKFAQILASKATSRRPKKEGELKQKAKVILLLEDPMTVAWSRQCRKMSPTKDNPITRFFFGDDSSYASQAEDNFAYQQYSHEVSDLLNRLEQEYGLVILLLDPAYAQSKAKNLQAVLEYGLGFGLADDLGLDLPKNAPTARMDRVWRANWEDRNQADNIFYMMAKGAYERRLNQVILLDKQLLGSTTELEKQKKFKVEL